jgi:hypothetical protein
MLQQMPPEQRKMMQERMKGMIGDTRAETKVSKQVIYIKEGKMRMEFEQGEGEKTFMVMDAKKRVIRNFFPERKAYLEMQFDEIEQMSKGLADMQKAMGREKQEKPGKLKKAGKKKTINGYSCQLYTQQVGKYVNEYWITKKTTMKKLMGEFADHLKGFAKVGGQSAQQEALLKIDGYPILIVRKDKFGTNRSEVTRIEKKKLPDNLFHIPAGYRKQSMKDLMNR